jgi:hypothetical protein
VCAKRCNELPFGGEPVDFGDVPQRLRAATDHARRIGDTRINFHPEARSLWASVYHDLSEGKPGLCGLITGRAEAQVIRLSLIYALLDCSPQIRAEHLRAALAVWRYCDDSAAYIWGDALGDPTADEIRRAVCAGVDGLTRGDLHNHFGRHKSAAELDRALSVLIERGLIRARKEETNGRPSMCYFRA